MGGLAGLMPRGQARFVLDALIVVWAAIWLGLGLLVHAQVGGLRDLGGTVSEVGTAVEDTGDAIQRLGRVPIVGSSVRDAGRGVSEAGQSTRESGQQTVESVDGLARTLGIAVGVVPTIPFLALYLPLRLGIARERRTVQELIDAEPDDRVLMHLLAQRALITSPYAVLKAEGIDPVDAARSDGSLRPLAEAELRRLGISSPFRR